MIVKRMIYLATGALLVMLILTPSALAQQYDAAPGDDDPYSPEQNVVVVEHHELERIAGQPLPQHIPAEPVPVPDGPPLPQSGGLVAPSVLLPVAVLLLGSGVLISCAVLRRRR